MEIPIHKRRFVMLAAYDVYAKALTSAQKKDEDVHMSTAQHGETLAILEHLKAELQSGDTNPQLGNVPVDVIAGWALEQRQLVAAWLRACELNTRDAIDAKRAELGLDADTPLAESVTWPLMQEQFRQARVTAPDVIDLTWFSAAVTLEDMANSPLEDADIDRYVEIGPWGVKAYEGEGITPGAEWILVRTIDGVEVEKGTGVHTGVDALTAARRAAATLNRSLVIYEPAHASVGTEEATVSVATADVPLHPADAE